MVDIQKLSLDDVRYIASQLEHSYGGGISDLIPKHPWIKDVSQEAVREIYGERFPVWRYLTVTKDQEIKPEKIVSVTANPSWALGEMYMAPEGYWKGPAFASELVRVAHAILRYEITPERVLVYVPAIIHIAMDMFGDSLMTWKVHKGRGGNNIHYVFKKILYENQEEEMLANVEGLTPQVIDLRKEYTDDAWWWNKSLLREVAQGHAMPPDEYAKDLLNKGMIKIDSQYDLDDAEEFFHDVYWKINDFFAL